MSSSGESSPVASPEPENVACYEECITDEIFIPPQQPAAADDATRQQSAAGHPLHGIPKANTSGRIAKRVRSRPKSLKNRKCSSPLVLQWLGDNYEMVSGSCLPRSVLYTHYQDFCKKNQVEASSAASFGKIIRLKFPDLSTRRLGTRGQSKYHYYGLAIKESSVYYRSVYSKKGLTRFSGSANKRENGQNYNPSSKTGILLPDFPKTAELNFTKPFPVDKVDTFLIMYRAHCQRILDSVVRANFHEVQDFLIHFWQGMPSHMLPILSCQATVDLVVVCDFILYRALCDVLIPASLQTLPDNLMDEIVVFSHNIVEWVFNSLQDLPAALGIRKVQTCEMFGKSLRRQSALVQLAKGVRGVLRNSEEVSCLLQDWRQVDVDAMIVQATTSNTDTEIFRELAHELEQLFIKQSALEVYFEWLDSIIEKRISEPCERGLSLVQLSHEFMATWTSFYSLLEKQFAASSTKSFEHYSSLHKLMDEYIHYVIELLQSQAIEMQYNEVLKIPISSTQPISSAQPPPLLQYPPDLYAAEDDMRLALPPTPDATPLPAERDFLTSFHHPHAGGGGKLAGELQTHHHHHHLHHHDSMNYFPSDLNSPFAPEGLCEGFIKPEFPSFKCGLMNMTPGLVQESPIAPFLDATPLTPQSSHFSSSSPLSHVSSIPSPEPYPSDLDPLPPHPMHHRIVSPSSSPTSVCSVDLATTGTYLHQQQHGGMLLAPTPVNDLDIVHSFDLITGAGNSSASMQQAVDAASYHSLSPVGQMSSSSSASSCSASPLHNSNYAQYEFELLQLMSNPDDLLADPKAMLHPSATPTPIH